MSWWVPYDQLLSLAGTRLSTNKSNERHVPGRTTRTIGAAKDLHLLLQQCPVREQEDEEGETRTWACPVRAGWGVPWQQTVKLIKVKTWTWHSNLTELAYLDVSKLSTNVSCLSHDKTKKKKKNREHLLIRCSTRCSVARLWDCLWAYRKWFSFSLLSTYMNLTQGKAGAGPTGV